MGLEVKQGQAFKIVELAYRKGLIDKAAPLVGEAMKSAMDDSEFGLGDLVEVINESSDETVIRIDNALKFAGPVLAVMGNERIMGPVMGLASRMLDFHAVQRATVWSTHLSVKAVLGFFARINARKLAALGVS